MSFGFPLGLWALLAMPALVAAYFLRRRQPPRVVSALFLWRTPDQRAEAGPRLERFSRETSLALELLAVLFAALFLGDLRCGASPFQRHLVVVVDGSLSMQARAGSSTVADQVRAAVAKLSAHEGATALTIVETGVRPTVLAGPQLERDQALALLEAWRPSQPAHDVSSALLLARELCTVHDQRVFFFTDGPVPDSTALLPQVWAQSLGRAQGNVGFLSAQRHDEGGGAVVTVRVGSFSDEALQVAVRFAAKGVPAQDHQVTLSPGASAIVRVTLPTQEDVTATLPEDALHADDTVTLVAAPLADVGVALGDGLDASAAAALQRFLAVAPGVKVEPQGSLSVGPPGKAARATVGAAPPLKSFVGPFFAQKGHPLLDDVQLGGVVWTAGQNPPGHPLMSAGEAVLLSEEEDGTLHFNLEVARSNVQRTVAWPVLWGNVVRQSRLNRPGFPRKHLMLGEDLPVVTAAGSAWALQPPEGPARPVLGVGALALPMATAPGRWQLLRDGQPFDALVVLPLDARESDLRTRGAFERRPSVGEAYASLGLALPRRVWPLVALLLVVLVDFWLTARPRAGLGR